MDLGASADGELLQRALDGEPAGDTGILELVAVLAAVSAVDHSGLAPRVEFVADLRARLLDEGGTAVLAPVVPLPSGDGTSPDAAQPGTVDPGPAGSNLGSTADPNPRTGSGATPSPDAGNGSVSVLRIAAGPLKWLAVAAAALVLVGGGLGVLARSAVPGDALYPIKQVLDRVAVQMAGSRFDQGMTHLAQAQQHITESRDLVDRGSPDPTHLDVALDAATESTRRAQTILVDVYRSEQRVDALTELNDFYVRALPQVDALRPRIPPQSMPSWQELRDLLAANRVATLREIAACAACGDRAAAASTLLSQLATGSAPTVGGAASGAGPDGSVPRPTAPRPGGASTTGPLPGASLPNTPPLPGVSLPGGTVNLPGVGVSSSSVGVGGGGVTLPEATVSLPTVGVTSTVVTGGGGGVSVSPLPTLTLPTVSVPLPTLSVPLPTVSLPLPTTILP